MTQQPTLKKSPNQEAKEIAISSIKELYNADFAKSCVIERRDVRNFDAWNVWMNSNSEDKLLKKGSIVSEKQVLGVIPTNYPFTIEMRDRDKISKFFNSRGYTHALKIIRDDEGSFWVGKPGGSMSVLPPIRA